MELLVRLSIDYQFDILLLLFCAVANRDRIAHGLPLYQPVKLQMIHLVII